MCKIPMQINRTMWQNWLNICKSAFVMALILLITASRSFATAWTTSVAGSVNNLSNWTDGSVSPTTFTTPGDTWTVNLAMTLPASVVWTLGTPSLAPVTLQFATGGAISMSGAGSTFTINVYGDMQFEGGTLSLGGAGTTANVTTNGNVVVNSGTISSVASSTHLNLHTYGDFTINGGTVTTSGASSWLYSYTHGNFAMTNGSCNAGGASGVLQNIIYGNCSLSGPASMVNTGAGCTNSVHLALHRSLGNMLINNTTTGTWSGTNIYVDSNCIARLNGDFSTNTGSTAYGLTVNGVLECPAAYVVNGARKFALNASGKLTVAHATGINGAITTTGTRTFNDTANYEFNGATAQVTGSYLPAAPAAPDTITINNPAGVSLSASVTSSGTLLFASGILHTGAYTITLPGALTAVVGAGSASYVHGMLQKTIAGTFALNYEVGDANYCPMKLSLSSMGVSGLLGVKSTNGMHPAVATSGISTSFIANHYWTITNTGASGPTDITPTATYNAVDIIGGSNTDFVTQKYSGSAWLTSALASINTSTIYTSAPVAGIAAASIAGDYIFGNTDCGTAPITGTTTVCEGSTTALSDATPGGVWTSASTGIATITGGGVVSGIAAGTSTISYTASGCTVTIVVTVNPLPNAGTITGAATVCEGRTYTFTDPATGGAWTSSDITKATVSTSGDVTGVAAGTATISYTVTNSCGTATATRTITVISVTECALGSNMYAVKNMATELTVYPNPNRGTFTLTHNMADGQNVHLAILDAVGRTVYNQDLILTDSKAEIALKNVAAGVYMLIATDSRGTQSKFRFTIFK